MKKKLQKIIEEAKKNEEYAAKRGDISYALLFSNIRTTLMEVINEKEEREKGEKTSV